MFAGDNNGMYIISDYDLQGDIVTRVSTGGLTDRTKLLLLVLLGSLVAAAIGAALGLFLMLRCDAPEDGDWYYNYGDGDKDKDKAICGEEDEDAYEHTDEAEDEDAEKYGDDD